MPAKQIAIRLTNVAKCQFEAYASGLGFNISEVVRLLIARERRLCRLMALSDSEGIPQRSGRQAGRRPAITAYLLAPERLQEFDKYAAQCGLNRDNAGAWLVEKELAERWLERALSLL